MKALTTWSPAPFLNVTAVEREESRWLITAYNRERVCCPVCGAQSRSHHSFYSRTLGDLSAQGIPVATTLSAPTGHSVLSLQIASRIARPALSSSVTRRTQCPSVRIEKWALAARRIGPSRSLRKRSIPTRKNTRQTCSFAYRSTAACASASACSAPWAAAAASSPVFHPKPTVPIQRDPLGFGERSGARTFLRCA
jgi:hypothetical protein